MDIIIKKMLREGLLRESENTQLSDKEQQILNDLIGETIDEGFDFNSMLGKINKYAKQGALTVGIIVSLLSNEAMGQEQKQAVLDSVQTEMSQEEVAQIKQKIADNTGLTFNDDYVKNNFAAVGDDSTSFQLPDNSEVEQSLVKSGIPKEIIDNVYINYVTDPNSKKETGAYISVRLKEDGNFKRLNQTNIKNKVYKRIVQTLMTYKPGAKKGLKDKEGNQYALNVDVVHPNGGKINKHTLKFKPTNASKDIKGGSDDTQLATTI